MQEQEQKFFDLTLDTAFKTLWYRGNKSVRKYLERMVEYAIGHPIGKYTLGPNEIGVLTYEQIANRVDVLLISEDKTYKVNVEMNRLCKTNSSRTSIDVADNKSDIYLSNFVANFYNDLDDTYVTPIKIEQVNFNAYYCPYDKIISRLDFEFVDLNYMITKNGVKSHQLYLPRLRDLCYTKDEEILKDFALLLSNSYSEMEEIAKGNKEREEVVEFAKSLGRDDKFMSVIDRKEYERVLFEVEKKEELKEARDEALKQGIEQGEKKTQIEMIKSLNDNKVPIETIAKSAHISIDEVKTILEDNASIERTLY